MPGQEKTSVVMLRDSLAQLSYWPRTLRLIWGSAPRWTIAWAVLLVVQGVLPAVSVFLTKLLVDNLAVTVGSGGGWEHMRPVLVLVALTAGVMILSEALQSLNDWIRTAVSEIIQDHIKGLIHRQAVAMDIGFFESSECHDRLDRARNEAGTRPMALLESCGGLIQNGITLIAMAAVLIPYGLWLPLILLMSTLPAFYVVLRFDRHYHRWWQQTTADRRRIQYYDLMLTHSHVAAELRLFSLGAFFQSAYRTLRQRLRTERLDQLRKQSLARLVAGVVALLFSGATMAWMVWRALQGFATLGDLALFYQAFSRGQGLMRSLLGNIGQIYSNTLFLGNLFDFLDMKPGVVDPSDPVPAPVKLKKGIDFRQITFRYPGSERVTLRDFALSIPAGKVVAIVGPNGAGKSTLLKLLCRFYDPEKGGIEIDGIDIRDLAIEDHRRLLTILFQFPLNHYATAHQSIALGDLRANPGLPEIEAAARAAGAHDLITGLPRGYDTMLGKWFEDGVELSGGEWQRIATARAYLRRSPILLLDEPTSFMDSWTEADWFERFRALAEGRTGIIITHRFTIAMRADIIHVMHNGEIVESGNHYELLAQGGLYARSWAAQIQAGSRCADEVMSEESVLEDHSKLEKMGFC